MENCKEESITISEINIAGVMNTAYRKLRDNNYPTNTYNKKMKETKQTRFKVVFQETRVTEMEYDVLAENLEDAKSKIESGRYGCASEREISLERIIKA